MDWYEFEGYVLVLRYDSGREERVTTFSDDLESFLTLWFKPGTLSKKRKD